MKKIVLAAALAIGLAGVAQAVTPYAVVSDAEIILPKSEAVAAQINRDLTAVSLEQEARARQVMGWYAEDTQNWHMYSAAYEIANSGPAYFSIRCNYGQYPPAQGVHGHDGKEAWVGYNYRLTDGKRITLSEYYGDANRNETIRRFKDDLYQQLNYELGGTEMADRYFADANAPLEFIIGMYDVPELLFAPGAITPMGYGGYEYRAESKPGTVVDGPRAVISRVAVMLPEHPEAAAKINAQLREAIGHYEQMARAAMQAAAGDDRRGDHYFAEVKTSLTNRPEEYVSVLIEYDQYTGGAHGLATTEGLVFNAQTGERVTLSQYRGEANKAETVAQIGDTLRTAVAERTGGDTFGLEAFLADPNQEFNFYLSQFAGSVVVFPHDSIGPWAIGEIRVEVPNIYG